MVARLRTSGSRLDEAYLDLLEENLRELTSSFGASLTRRSLSLTPRETDICGMIRNGLSSKEIAQLLRISVSVVENYRHSIRKKLGLANKRANLATYLRSL